MRIAAFILSTAVILEMHTVWTAVWRRYMGQRTSITIAAVVLEQIPLAYGRFLWVVNVWAARPLAETYTKISCERERISGEIRES